MERDGKFWVQVCLADDDVVWKLDEVPLSVDGSRSLCGNARQTPQAEIIMSNRPLADIVYGIWPMLIPGHKTYKAGGIRVLIKIFLRQKQL